MRILNWRTLTAGIGTAVTVVGSLFAVSSPALADYSCPSAQVCFYQDSNGHGSPATLAALAQGGPGEQMFWNHLFHNGVNLNDQASSVHNNTNQWLEVYAEGGYGGRWQRVQPGGWANFTGGGIYNDTASSARFIAAPCTAPDWC